MKSVRLYMIFQWVFFLPIILPLCVIVGAIYGIVQMVERVMDQIIVDISAPDPASSTTLSKP